MAVGIYVYVCVKNKDNKYKISVIDRMKKKQVYYQTI